MFFHLCSAVTARLSLVLVHCSWQKEVCENMESSSGLTFRKAELLQLTGQWLTVNIMLCRTGENEAEHRHTGFDVSALCKISACYIS